VIPGEQVLEEEGLVGREAAIRAGEADFLALANREISLGELHKAGKTQVSGDLDWLNQVALRLPVLAVVRYLTETISVRAGTTPGWDFVL